MRLAFAAMILFANVAGAQTAPPVIWTGRLTAIPGIDQEYAGVRSVGDTLAESSYSDGRTAGLVSVYDATIQGEHVVLPVGTPFVARGAPISVAVDGDATPRPTAAPGTVVWCALPQTGFAPCFFWDAAEGIHGHALTTGGAPSERGWLGTATAAPAPNIVEGDADLPPNETRLVLHDVNAEGYVVRLIRREGGREYSRIYRRQAWNSWHYTWAAPAQRMRATPVADGTGVITGANVEFTRERSQ